MTQPREILILGTEGSGKSLLVRRIKEYAEIKHSGNIQALKKCELLDMNAIPTIGVEITPITSVNNSKFLLREIGTSMALKWSGYYRDCMGVVFVIDEADDSQYSSAAVLLHEIIAEYVKLQNGHICIIHNKCDMCEIEDEFLSNKMIFISSLIATLKQAKCEVYELSGSCTDYILASDVYTWIVDTFPVPA